MLPMTYELDGRQYLLVAANDNWFAFAVPESENKKMQKVIREKLQSSDETRL